LCFFDIKFAVFGKIGKTYKHIPSITIAVESMGTKTGHSVFLDDEDLEFLKEKSVETGRSLSTLIREAVKKWIREEKQK
jgi:hypothetical protein